MGVVTYPFTFEGRRRSNQAVEGIAALRSAVDSVIVRTGACAAVRQRAHWQPQAITAHLWVCRASAACNTPDGPHSHAQSLIRSSPTTSCWRWRVRARRCRRPSAWRTTCCARACRCACVTNPAVARHPLSAPRRQPVTGTGAPARPADCPWPLLPLVPPRVSVTSSRCPASSTWTLPTCAPS